MKRVVILGSTGSIGISALDVIKSHPRDFQVVGLSTNSNISALAGQIKKFRPKAVCVNEERSGRRLKKETGSLTKIFFGKNGLPDMLESLDIDRAVLAISGSAALLSLLRLIDKKVDVALANKEALVMAGPIIMRRASQKKVNLIPIDSEQSAIWQCLAGQAPDYLKTIYLTASGGPFRKLKPSALKKISVKQALNHPRWKMGRKISVDSATLMNKGLELLEAMYLFSQPAGKIKVVIHPEAIIHSMVEYIDGSVLAQLSITDMRVPIQYALSYPQRMSNGLPHLDFFKIKQFNFEKPDLVKFPCLDLAYQAASEEGTAPCVLNAANEIAVSEFLKENLDFTGIARVIEKTLEAHKNKINPALADIFAADSWARQEAAKIIGTATFCRTKSRCP